jgi:glucose/arabinose dehydrogenase
MKTLFENKSCAMTKKCIKLVLSFFISYSLYAQSPVIIFNPAVSSGLNSPVDIVNAADGSNRLFIVQQNGIIRFFTPPSTTLTTFLDISSVISTGGERGLLSLAFHPDYENNRYFFVYYTNTSGDITIARYQTFSGNPNAADPASGVVLLNIPKPFSNHNGGDLNFGPDGNLFFGTGDGGSGGDPSNFAQNGNSLLGKMIRLNVDNFTTPPYYTIPADNPFLTDPAIRDEIFALGLRNPWRWSFDRLNNDMWIADVGQGLWEEVNTLSLINSAGVNYGWRCYEGNAAYNTAGCQPQSSYTSPVFEYPHNFATGGFSITGGFVYRGTEFPSLFGYYICADYVSGNVWLIRPNGGGGWISTIQAGLPGSVSTFGEAENGDMYCASLSGTVYKINVDLVLPFRLKLFAVQSITGYNELKWETVDESNLLQFEIESSLDAVNFSVAGIFAAHNSSAGFKYNFSHFTAAAKTFYRLKITELGGRHSYSNIITAEKTSKQNIKIYPSIIESGQVTVYSDEPVQGFEIYSPDGKMVFSKPVLNLSGTISITIPSLRPSIYFARIKTETRIVTEKIIVR